MRARRRRQRCRADLLSTTVQVEGRRVKNKRPPSNSQSRQKPKFVDELELEKLAESPRIQSLKREAEKLAQSPRIQSLKREAEKFAQFPHIQNLKRGLDKLAEIKRAERERELEQEIKCERQQRRVKERPPKRGGRHPTLTQKMEGDARDELKRWLGEQASLPKQQAAYDHILDWLKSDPRKIKVRETTVRTRIVAPVYRELRDDD